MKRRRHDAPVPEVVARCPPVRDVTTATIRFDARISRHERMLRHTNVLFFSFFLCSGCGAVGGPPVVSRGTRQYPEYPPAHPRFIFFFLSSIVSECAVYLLLPILARPFCRPSSVGPSYRELWHTRCDRLGALWMSFVSIF